MVPDAGLGMLRLPGEVRFGWGVRAAVPRIVSEYGDRVLIVADPVLAQTPPFGELVHALREAGAQAEVLTRVPAELPVEEVHLAAGDAARFAPDVVVGYGGGSALDAAKLVSLLCAHGGELPDYYGENAVTGPVLPLVAIPTTAGTGSEVTPVAVVSDPDRALKVGVSSRWLVPSVAVVDPELTTGAPGGVTAHSGIDAFVHAAESFTARPLDLDPGGELPVFVGRNPLTDPLSLEAAALIHGALPRVVAEPSDAAARTDMSRGSLLAGMAFGAAGTHLSHAIQYPVGAMTHTPHGLGTGTLLPFVLQACLPAVPDRLATLAGALGVAGAGTIEARAQAAVDAIAELCLSTGLPRSLAELGLSATDVPRVVELTGRVTRLLEIAPIHPDEAVLEAIVSAAVDGDRDRLRNHAAIRPRVGGGG